MTLNQLLIMARSHRKHEAVHPTIERGGKKYFWSLTRKEYVLSACQPKGKN